MESYVDLKNYRRGSVAQCDLFPCSNQSRKRKRPVEGQTPKKNPQISFPEATQRKRQKEQFSFPPVAGCFTEKVEPSTCFPNGPPKEQKRRQEKKKCQLSLKKKFIKVPLPPSATLVGEKKNLLMCQLSTIYVTVGRGPRT